MTHTFKIVEARPYHCGRMIRLLRKEHKNALVMIGARAHEELRGAYDASPFRKAWLIDGELAALGGVIGTQLSSAGYIWLALSEAATKYPLAVMREAKRQIAEVLMVKRLLIATTLEEDKTSARFVRHLGFETHLQKDSGRDVWLLRRAIVEQREAA